jgi:hypothetical protein
MTAVLVRVFLLTIGLAALEIGLGGALRTGDPGSWALALLVGIPALLAGSIGFIAPLFGGRSPYRR